MIGQNSSTRQNMFQPILRNKDSDSKSQGPVSKKSGSGPIEKKSKSINKITMKEQPFIYEEKSANSKKSQLSGTPNTNTSNKFQHQSPYQNRVQEFNIVNEQNQRYLNVQEQDQDNVGSDVDFVEQRCRPSDEVQYSQGYGSFNQTSPLKSGYQQTLRVNNSSNKEDSIEGARFSNHPVNEHFQVIEEEEKDYNYYDHKNRRDNSDMKKYNNDEDNQQQIIKGKNVIHSNESQKQRYQAEQKNHSDETPNSIFLKTRNIESNQLIVENSLQSSNYFIEGNMQIKNNNGALSPQSFGSPDEEEYFRKSSDNLQAHILSFSDKNQIYQIDQGIQLQVQQSYENLKFKQQESENRPLLNQPLSDQQQKINEILQSSQSSGQLQTLTGSNKMDEKQLNSMIDLEKNYVIVQYENILQQLNIEFQKLLLKTKDTEETLASKEAIIHQQIRILNDKEDQQFQQEQINRQLQDQVQELLGELDHMQKQQKILQHSQSNAEHGNEAWRYEKEFLEQKVMTLQNKIMKIEQNESDISGQLETALARVRNAEQKLRSKEEDMFTMSRDNQAQQRDIKSMKEIENQLRSEIQSINSQRLSQEDTFQDIKQQLCNTQIQIRQKESEIDILSRDNRSLKGTVEILQKNLSDISLENNLMKEGITDQERNKMQIKGQVDRKDQDIRNMQQEIKRLQMINEQDKQAMRSMEQHFTSEIQSILQQQNHLQQAVKQQQSFENEPQYPLKQQHKNPQLNDSYYKSSEQLNNTIVYSGYSDKSKPLQETHNTFYSPQRNQRGQNLQQNGQVSPRNQKTQNQSKNTIAWPFLYGGNPNIQNQQQKQSSQYHQESVVQLQNERNAQFQNNNQNYPQQRQPDEDGSMRRRKTVQNQNQSSLNEVFSWGSSWQSYDQRPGQNQYPTGAKSLERPFNQNKHAYTQQQPNYHQAQKQSFDLQEQQQQYALAKRSHQSSQDQDLQPAGKKTLINHSPIPTGKNNKNTEQQITHLQNSLSALQIDKERVENEFRKMGQPKNKQQIEKKQELEFEIEITNKNIQNLRTKLRELNAI